MVSLEMGMKGRREGIQIITEMGKREEWALFSTVDRPPNVDSLTPYIVRMHSNWFV